MLMNVQQATVIWLLLNGTKILQRQCLQISCNTMGPTQACQYATPFHDIASCATRPFEQFFGQSWCDCAGVYNEEAFRALDQIIDDASRSGIKLILAFTDNWHLQDGLFQYVAWANSTETGDFFTDPKVIQLFKDHITNIVNRTNTLNGRQYKDEPAIFAWDLINELRDGCNTSAPNATCAPSFPGAVQVRRR